MDHREDFKAAPCEQHESQTKVQRNEPEHDPGSGSGTRPGADCVSLMSNCSKDLVILFKEDQPSAAQRVEPAGERWLIPGLKKYSCELTIDINTVHRKIKLSEDNRKMTHVKEDQSYPDHPDRFDECRQLLCSDGLTGRCYWEVDWRGGVEVSVSYRGIGRKGSDTDYEFGSKDKSWSLVCSGHGLHVFWHNKKRTTISSSVSNRVAVYVDCPAGTLSFYSVSSDGLIHLYTCNTTFTEPIYPGFRVWLDSSVSLC